MQILIKTMPVAENILSNLNNCVQAYKQLL